MSEDDVRAIAAALAELPDGWHYQSNGVVRWAGWVEDLLQERARLVAYVEASEPLIKQPWRVLSSLRQQQKEAEAAWERARDALAALEGE